MFYILIEEDNQVKVDTVLNDLTKEVLLKYSIPENLDNLKKSLASNIFLIYTYRFHNVIVYDDYSCQHNQYTLHHFNNKDISSKHYNCVELYKITQSREFRLNQLGI